MVFLNRKSAIGNRKSSGVTLIEIVISIFVLSVGVLGIISLFPSGYRLSQAAIDRSIATLAAQEALSRILAEARNGTVSLPGPGDPLFPVSERDRVGTIAAVPSDKSVECVVCGDFPPQSGNLASPHYWSPSLGAGYYLVMTSGACAGAAYRINGVSGKTITLALTSGMALRTGGAAKGEPIRVGDHFAIIGAIASKACFPLAGSAVPTGQPSITASFSDTSGVRTMPVSTEGDYTKTPYLYSYGALLSPPTPEMRRLCRVDVFVFRGFNPGAVFNRPAAHVVAYVPNFADFANPDK